jgi:glutamate N-acetyltransferase/amino-acid N-acetyltransferase
LASGISAGIKSDNSKDLGLLYSEKPATAVGVFTTNHIKAAPVILTRDKIRKGLAQALIVNSGNANACTGPSGLHNAKSVSERVSRELGINDQLVMLSSTGIIGVPLPLERIESHIQKLVISLAPGGLSDFSEAIMTTDTFPKMVIRKKHLWDKEITICGIGKGSGMIMPSMATLLAYIITDASIEHGFLEDLLKDAVNTSFNALTIDGETSTNDTVIMMANGCAGNKPLSTESPESGQFKSILKEVVQELSHLILKDAEGSTKIIHVRVQNALTREDAKKIAYKVANSALVKTAFFGEDPNWGRIMSAIGQTEATIDPEGITIWFDDLMVVKSSACTGSIEPAKDILRQPEFRVVIDVNSGTAGAEVDTTDLTVEYVKINSDYPT